MFILANWRGFSGGQRDMFHQILKYGSMIVDELADYKQPVFIYLPPTAELRGGAWVVLDSLINDRVIEMYSAEGAKANVLEPTATVGLKYRKKKLLSTMHRIDPQLISLDASLAKKEKISPNDVGGINEIKKEIENRERGLFPIYNKIALMYAQLHDTPQRMKDVRVIKEVVEWRASRKYFYWRLRRKLSVSQSIDALVGDMALSENEWKKAQAMFDEFVAANFVDDDDDVKTEEDVNDAKLRGNDEIIPSDEAFVKWFCSKTKEFAQFRLDLKKQSIEKKLRGFVKEFGANKKEIKQMFEKIMSEKNGDEADVVNID